jgi:hypothetical protein
MAAIITDQLRILQAKNFVAAATSSSNRYYSFVGLPNPTDYSINWDENPLDPKDSFEQETNYWDSMIALKKISSDDVRQVVRKINWESGITYDMYRHDISRDNIAPKTRATSLYSSNYYVLNSDYRVYICLYNGAGPENNFEGNPSLDEPTFTDLEPRSAGNSGDGYVWKYLYTIKPSDIVKFESTNFMPVPRDWETNTTDAAVRDNASSSGQIKIVTIRNRGVGLGTANAVYTSVPINGDGEGATCTITINNDSKVESVVVSNGGSGYTYGSVDLEKGNVPTGTERPQFDVIIPPKGGHGADIYRELGAKNVLIYSRIENDLQNPDFITGNQIARVGIVENPLAYSTNSLLDEPKASALYALKLIGIGYSTINIPADSFVTQTIGVGSTAVGRVVSYDKNTGVLKIWQEKTNSGFNTNGSRNISPTYGFKTHRFTSSVGTGGTTLVQINESINNLFIDTQFTGITTTLNTNTTYYLGQQFANGVANPEVQKYSGNIIYVDNRPAITRSTNQKEDIKVILQF